jgi:glycine hydroxymethyltransferase
MERENMRRELDIVDPELAEAIRMEWERLASSIDLIAALNFPSRAVTEVQGSVFATRRCEGYPGRRYHGGTKYLDVIENLARDRAKQLFGAEHANVQPHSGVNANMAVYFAVLKPGSRLLGMDLTHGGHLSHGYHATLSGRIYNAEFYGVDPTTELINYDQVLAIAQKVQPHMIICGGSSYARVIDFAKFRKIADEVGAYLLADVSHFAGLIAGGVYPSPVPYSDFVTFTTYKTLRGCAGGTILSKASFAHKIDTAIFPGIQGTMHAEMMGAKAVTFRLAMTPEFKTYASQVIANARALAKALQDRGFRIVSGGTDSHIVLIDLRARGITGSQAQEVLENVGIVTNKNVIPFDPLRADQTSGLRLGSGGVTVRGFREEEMRAVADIVTEVLSDPENSKTLQLAQKKVKQLCLRFPLNWKGDN